MAFSECIESPSTSKPPQSIGELFDFIAAGNEAAVENLYRMIGRTVQAKIRKEFPDDHEDVHHLIFLDVLRAIQEGVIRKPEALFGYVRTIIRRRSSELIGSRIINREALTELSDYASAALLPDAVLIEQQKMQIALIGLHRLNARDQQIVNDYYLNGRSRDEVIQSNELTETQFRLLKSRALKRMRQTTAEYVSGTRTSTIAKAI